MTFSRRHILALLASLPIQATATRAVAQETDVWSVQDAHQALSEDKIILVDIRSRAEWKDSGLAQNALPIGMHEADFAKRLFAVRELAGDRPVAVICATGRRSGSVMRALRQAGHTGFIDVTEGMFGSAAGPGWTASGLPVVSAEEALNALPPELH